MDKRKDIEQEFNMIEFARGLVYGIPVKKVSKPLSPEKVKQNKLKK